MHKVLIQNLSSPLPQAILAEYSTGFWAKFKGLMLRPSLSQNSGIVLVESSDSRLNTAIHMLFMLFDITAIWVNDQMEVVDVKIARKWRPSYVPVAPAKFVIETHVTHEKNFKTGDKVHFAHA